MRRAGHFLLVGAVVWILIPLTLYAQKLTGTISGTITDTSGAAVPGASIVATNTATSKMFSANADAQGSYTIAEIPDSTYNVKITAANFKEFVPPMSWCMLPPRRMSMPNSGRKCDRSNYRAGQCPAGADR